jgi:LmbE family N-acetylglucosaminyl deacetylase
MNKTTLPLSNPNIPLVGIQEIAQQKVVVVAPHPDDETLGCGGAIAQLHSLGCDVQVLVMSDGTLSHPRSQKYPVHKLRTLRELETLEALKILGVTSNAVTFLRFKDGSISIQDKTAESICRKYLSRVTPQLIFLPWRYDPHPDHRSTYSLITTALQELLLAPRIIEYPIWDWDEQQRENLPEFLKVSCWRLDIRSVVNLKQQAISAYRSQITNLIDDDPEGFQLTPEMLANFAHPWEIYLEVVRS